jgi:hypothetical protein
MDNMSALVMLIGLIQRYIDYKLGLMSLNSGSQALLTIISKYQTGYNKAQGAYWHRRVSDEE